MTLEELLRKEKPEITSLWLKKTLATYPQDASVFFKKEKNQFANPVGQTLSSGLEAIYATLLEKMDAEKLCTQLDEVIKVRSVQDFTPSKAVVFVFMLKDAIRETLKDELKDQNVLSQLSVFELKIDQLALFAFDLFVKTREKMYQLRVNEVKRQVSTLMKRSGYFVGDLDQDTDHQ
jgi:RsbRD-like negative regulator of sigma factor